MEPGSPRTDVAATLAELEARLQALARELGAAEPAVPEPPAEAVAPAGPEAALDALQARVAELTAAREALARQVDELDADQ